MLHYSKQTLSNTITTATTNEIQYKIALLKTVLTLCIYREKHFHPFFY
jgi:hypothetical protein